MDPWAFFLSFISFISQMISLDYGTSGHVLLPNGVLFVWHSLTIDNGQFYLFYLSTDQKLRSLATAAAGNPICGAILSCYYRPRPLKLKGTTLKQQERFYYQAHSLW